MKRLLPIVLGLSIALSGASVLAGTASQFFNVKVNFTATCLANNSSRPVVDFGNYTAFGSASKATPTAGISFKCSRGLAPNGVTIQSSNAASATGSVAGLVYTVSVDPLTVVTTPANSTQDYDAFTYTVSGVMAPGQAGDSLAATTPTVETLVVSF